MLDLFTFLVFLLVFTGVYTARAFGRRQRREEAVAARLATLRTQLLRESGGAAQALQGDSILLSAEAPLVPAWPWLSARLARLREGLRQLGWLPSLRQRVLFTACGAFIGGLLLGRMTASPLLVSLLAGVVLFVAVAALAYQSAMAKYLAGLARSLPEAIDAITRVCRAGVPLHSAFAIAADHLQGPLVGELRQVDQWLRLGVPIRQAMQDSALRVPLAEYRFFAVILIISQESGGRLGDTLDRLSATLRARAELKMKVLAKTSEARASTKIVALLVPGVLGYMYLNAPEDFRFLFSDPAGIKVVVYAAVSVGLGLLITHLMVRRIG
ncbi:hypothetical protein E6C76_02400 [Pseudothauera nasutitermitis]|uniref:Type II secretion system protein GspF domain-containing protein n=1 Tax=Pseudothauera nasutitermitis TaxID=2565930 RepID=A0A4S4B3J7_9RHOO|nr:type II secretion system F family protein [Pseudothauera nasutitermitis]THF67248.1 hypothetical protein E6C76_02400 [Pseudothauera nasutitermitis]